jgi:hypothetical protein
MAVFVTPGDPYVRPAQAELLIVLQTEPWIKKTDSSELQDNDPLQNSVIKKKYIFLESNTLV